MMITSLRNYILICVTVFIFAPDCTIDQDNPITIPGDDTQHVQDTLHVQDTQTIIQGDFTGLKVGNSWIFQQYNVNSNYYDGDSSIRTITVTGNTDSIWYLSIKDSIYSFNYNFKLYDTIPKVIYQYDTCIQQANTIQCKILTDYFRYHKSDRTRYHTINYNNSVIPYYKYSVSGIINSDLFYVRDIGPCKLSYSHYGVTNKSTSEAILLKFNGQNILFTNSLL